MDKLGVEYYLREPEYEDARASFVKLAKQYSIKHVLKPLPKNNNHSDKYSSKNEEEFVKEVLTAKSPQKIRALYKKLSDYKNRIELQKSNSWQTLIDKTFEITGGVTPFIKYLKDLNYPHTDFYTTNSKHLHLALGYALDNPDYKTETLQYLFHNGGHDGFLNLIRSYAEVGNREMCLKLFERFMALCKLLTD